jgi:hypothetical protein
VINLIKIYYTGENIFVVGLVQQPNLTWKSVIPAIECSPQNEEELSKAIETAKSYSRSYTKNSPSSESQEYWDGENGTIWDTSIKTWSIKWYDNGSVMISPEERVQSTEDPQLAGGFGWRRIQGAEKNILPPISMTEIARSILLII